MPLRFSLLNVTNSCTLTVLPAKLVKTLDSAFCMPTLTNVLIVLTVELAKILDCAQGRTCLIFDSASCWTCKTLGNASLLKVQIHDSVPCWIWKQILDSAACWTCKIYDCASRYILLKYPQLLLPYLCFQILISKSLTVFWTIENLDCALRLIFSIPKCVKKWKISWLCSQLIITISLTVFELVKFLAVLPVQRQNSSKFLTMFHCCNRKNKNMTVHTAGPK